MEQVSPRMHQLRYFSYYGEEECLRFRRVAVASAALECIANKAFAKYRKTIVITVNTFAFF